MKVLAFVLTGSIGLALAAATLTAQPPDEQAGPPEDRMGPPPQQDLSSPEGRQGPRQEGFGRSQRQQGPPQRGFGRSQGRQGPPQYGFGRSEGRQGPPPRHGFGRSEGRQGPPQRGAFGHSEGWQGPQQHGFGPPPPLLVIVALDADLDGELSAEEIDNAPEALRKLDRDDDGRLDSDELHVPLGHRGASRDRTGRRGPPGLGPGRGQGGPSDSGGDRRANRPDLPPSDELPPA